MCPVFPSSHLSWAFKVWRREKREVYAFEGLHLNSWVLTSRDTAPLECMHYLWFKINAFTLHECMYVRVFSRKHTMLGLRNESGLLNCFKQSKTWWKNELLQTLHHCKYLHYSRLQSGHAQSIFSIRWDVHLPQSISSARPLVWQLLCPHSSWCARPLRSPSSARTSALGSWAGTWSGGPVHCEEE